MHNMKIASNFSNRNTDTEVYLCELGNIFALANSWLSMQIAETTTLELTAQPIYWECLLETCL